MRIRPAPQLSPCLRFLRFPPCLRSYSLLPTASVPEPALEESPLFSFISAFRFSAFLRFLLRFRPRSRPRHGLQCTREVNPGNQMLSEQRGGGRDELMGGDRRKSVAWGLPCSSRRGRGAGGPENGIFMRHQGDRPRSSNRRGAAPAARSRRRGFTRGSAGRCIPAGGGTMSRTRGAAGHRASCLAAHTFGRRQRRIGHDATDPII